ncbi:hypothetical protein D3093_35400 (plasmid) [Azospirillum argentinense]|uniref:Uncharacterized protein n=1 Tax=Azospirillum argentinense TaxID=2970906 RepID=A0A4D8Q2P8_9PROT|nr:hypothetical protein [Azospirillum argentinense]QCO00532.1 hypothetical protein D3093_35400 [Azospirillum argentinense]
MGTSTSHPGPGSNSPLVPSWADSNEQAPQPEPEGDRFRGFRTKLGQFVSGGDHGDLRSALGRYARTATGGRAVGSRRFGSMARSGGALFDAMAALRDGRAPDVSGIDLATLNGRDTDLVIEALVDALVPPNGDADRIRVAMQEALSEALEGMVEFDFNQITDDIIVDMMLAYVTQCIYEQIVLDSRDAFAKATSAGRVEQAEKAMRELVRSATDTYMEPLLTGNVRTLNGRMVEAVQLRAIADIWAEWEAYNQ